MFGTGGWNVPVTILNPKVLEEFENIDKKIASRMKNNGATYLVITTIRSEESEIGYFGFTYCNDKEPKDYKYTMEFMVKSVQKLSKLLDKNKGKIK